MQRVLRLVVVAGLAMYLPTVVRGDDGSRESMDNVYCTSDGRTIVTTGCLIHPQTGQGDSDASDFLNTYVDNHFDDTMNPFSCATKQGAVRIYVDRCIEIVNKLRVPDLNCNRNSDDTYYLYSKTGKCDEVVGALKALSHSTTTTPKPAVTKTTTEGILIPPTTTSTTKTKTTTITKPTTTATIPKEGGNDDGAKDFSDLRVDCASGPCSLVDVCDYDDDLVHSRTTWQLQTIFTRAAFKCKGGRVYFIDAKQRYSDDLNDLDVRAGEIGCAGVTTQKGTDYVAFELAGDGRLIFPAEFENNAAACQTMRNNLVSVLTSYATGADDNSGCKVAVTSTTTTMARTTTTTAKPATTTTAAAALIPSLEAMVCDAQPYSTGTFRPPLATHKELPTKHNSSTSF